jgi:putative ABC transport system permease protein
LKSEVPGIVDFVRIYSPGDPVLIIDNRKFIEDKFLEADSSFFRVFSVPLLTGDPNKVLNAPHTLVLSRTSATKFFGKENPIGRSIRVGHDPEPYRVTGIMQDMPDNAHFKAEVIASFVTNPGSADPYWGNNNYATYVVLGPNVDPVEVDARLSDLVRKYMGDIARQSLGITIDEFLAQNKYSIHLQPLRKIHLEPGIIQIGNMLPARNPKYLYIFGSVALLIIVIAAINFMNLSTAQAARRSREVGIKKVTGSSRQMLVYQFLAESFVISFAALVLAVLIVENTLPLFNRLLGIQLQFNLFGSWYHFPAMLILTLFIALLSGSYPAFYLSSFEPASILKGKQPISAGHGRLRKVLVILQFSISMILIVGTLIMIRQIRFMLNKDLGFHQEQMMVISNTEAIGNHIASFKAELLTMADVLFASASTQVPGHGESGKTLVVDGRPGDLMEFRINYVDYDFFKTYGLKTSQGRNFSPSFSADKTACLINESAVRQLNLESPLTSVMLNIDQKLPVIGVLSDFHFEPLQIGINPYMFFLKDDSTNYGYITARLSGNNTKETLNAIESLWDKYAPDDPFRYFFLDQDFASRYNEEKQFAQLAFLLSLLAIIIASLGLFGLTSFTVEQRTKEIGIRKSMGASSLSVFFLIAREFLILVCIAGLISFPVILYAADAWLQNYYYQIKPGPMDFIAGLVISLIVALGTLTHHTLKSSRINTVEALRNE